MICHRLNREGHTLTERDRAVLAMVGRTSKVLLAEGFDQASEPLRCLE